MLKLNSFNSLVTTKKFKKAKKNKVYDKEWNMLFVNEKSRLDFRKAISNAEEDIKKDPTPKSEVDIELEKLMNSADQQEKRLILDLAKTILSRRNGK